MGDVKAGQVWEGPRAWRLKVVTFDADDVEVRLELSHRVTTVDRAEWDRWQATARLVSGPGSEVSS